MTATATVQMEVRWAQAGARPQPKIHTPRKMDSKKKAASPSNARGAPKMSPTKLAYSGTPDAIFERMRMLNGTMETYHISSDRLQGASGGTIIQ